MGFLRLPLVRGALAVVGLAAAVYAVASLAGGWMRPPPIGAARETSSGVGSMPSRPPRLAVSSSRQSPRPAGAEVVAPDGAQSPAVREGDSKEKSLDEIRADIEAHRWAVAREGIEAIRSAHPDEADATRKTLGLVMEDFEQRRKAYFAELAGARFPAILRTSIAKRVADREETCAATLKWLRKDSVDAAFESLCRELRDADPQITDQEVKGFWDGRPRTNATWKPHTPSLLAPLLAQSALSPASDSTVVAHERWWARASEEQRREECFAILVEKSGLFEVDEKNGRVSNYR